MDAYLAVASKRDERRYAEREVPPEVVERILDAGRLAGSGSNRQPWRFVVVESREARERLAQAVYAPENVRGAALAIALIATGGRRAGFDHGRSAQNMMLVAWNEGVASCPNGIRDPEAAAELLAPAEDEVILNVLSLGYPARPRNPEPRSAEEWSARANRKPLADLVSGI
jgi:nitroreductase